MPLLKSGAFVEDGFVTLGADDAVPAEGDIILPFDRFIAEFDTLKLRPSRLGVVFPVAGDLDALKAVLFRLDAIVLPFAAFTDGRAFSLARIIRTRFGFSGELRSAGPIIPDQIAFLRQVGFDAFEVNSNRHGRETWIKAATAMTLTYQKGFLPKRGFAPVDVFEARQARSGS